MPPLLSAALYVPIVVLQSIAIEGRESEIPLLWSANISGLAVVLLAQRGLSKEVNIFITQKEKQTAVEKTASLKEEFIENLKEFLPTEIYRRIIKKLNQGNVSPRDAVKTVLKPKSLFVACMFSDIRGYTSQSRRTAGFVQKSVLPNVEVCVDAIEKYQGIVQTIGDALFAYFDFASERTNVYLALMAGAELLDETSTHNKAIDSDAAVRRFVTVASGVAAVGNLGGKMGCFKITAMGDCANLSQRLDEVTKAPAIKNIIGSDDTLIIDKCTYDVLPDLWDRIDVSEVNIHTEGLTIRDFPEVDTIYLIKVNEESIAIIREEYEVDNTQTFTLIREQFKKQAA